jgi:hypothetical protein
LIAHLVSHPSLAKYGIQDADSLFEFFLIDVRMGACLQTSRIKQAISTVQQFVQRCLLGIEEQSYPVVKSDFFDRQRWQWMAKQTLWTANRKVFLYPESYLEPSLRDDKSDLYEAMESELLRKDIGPDTIRDSLGAYLIGLGERASLVVQGIFRDIRNRVLHFVARTSSSPFTFFYRTYSFAEKNWTPWQVRQL